MDENTDPNAQMVDPQVGDDEMAQFLASLEEGFEYAPNINLSTLSPQGDTATDDPPDDAPDDDDTPDDDPAAPDEPDDDTVTVNGQQYARSEIERLFEFDKFLKANPDTAQRVAQAITAEQPTLPPAAQAPPDKVEFVPPEVPETVDLDDPNAKFLWDQLVESRKEAWEIRQAQIERDQRYLSDQQSIAQRQAQEDMAVALDQFTKQFPHLNDDDMKIIRDEATPLVQGMMAHNPPVEALRRSMEAAAWANSDIRPKLTDPATPNPSSKQTSAKRKQRLGSLSGSPRSAPKVDSRPTYANDREMVQGFADALAEQGLGR